MSPYAILTELREQGGWWPATVYRALERLEAECRIHRLPSVGAYILCSVAQTNAGSHFLLCCSCCGQISEHPSQAVSDELAGAGASWQFDIQTTCIELFGLCRHCRAVGLPGKQAAI